MRSVLLVECMIGYLQNTINVFFKFVLSLHTSAPVAALVPEMIDVAWDLKALKVLRRVKGFLIVWGCLEVKSWCGSFMPQWSDFGGTQNSNLVKMTRLIFVLHWLYHYHYTFQALGQILHLCQSWWKRQNRLMITKTRSQLHSET